MTGTASDKSALSRLKQQWKFIRKELQETLRDRRTIVTLLAMPLLLYPLLGMGFRFLALRQTTFERPKWQISADSEQELAWLDAAMRRGSSYIERSDVTDTDVPYVLLLRMQKDTVTLEEQVAAGVADVGARIKFSSRHAALNIVPADIEVIVNDGSHVSRDAADYIQRRIQALNLDTVSRWATQQDNTFLIPLKDSRTIVQPLQEVSAILGFLPLVLLLMTVTGGVYPAIDLTAGERERDTLETLMALPVPKFRLIGAKFVAVVTVTMLTGLVNLFAMSATVYSLQLESTLFGESGLTLSLLLRLVLVLFAFAIFYSSLLLVITSSARSFKEAQAYLIPMLLLSIAPGLVVLLPGWQLNHGTAVAPMINMLLLAKSVFEGTAELFPSVIALISTVSYAVIFLMFAALVFGTDAASTGSRGRWSDLFKRPQVAAAEPTPSAALSVLALLFPVHFLATGLLARAADSSMLKRVALSGILTVFMFAVIPAASALWQRVSLVTGFRAGMPRWLAWPGAILLGLSTWPIVFEAVMVMQALGLRSFDVSKMEAVDRLLTAWKSIPPALTVLVFGVLPGLCEELFFRGYLFAGMRRHFSGTATVLVSALVFGAFHVILAAGAAPERMIPSTLMGLLLGWVALRTNSVLPGIVIHILHNSLLLIIAQSKDELAGWGIGVVEESHFPAAWLLISAICVVAGAVTVHLSTRAAILPASEFDSSPS